MLNEFLKDTRPEVEKYLQGLEPEIREIYTAAEQFFLVTEDTLSEEFQIAASIIDVFWSRVRVT